MENVVRRTDPEVWIDLIFSAKAVADGGVIRRHRRWVDREVGRSRFVEEVRRRGFHLIETTDQLIVVCNRGPVRMHF